MRGSLFALVLLLAACGRPAAPASYPQTTQLNFMRACQTHSSAALCGCIWRRIAADVPVADFNALEQLPGAQREAHPLMQQINGYAMACQASPTPREPAPKP